MIPGGPPQPHQDSGGGFLSNLFSGKEGGMGKLILGVILGLMVACLFGGGFNMLTGLLTAGGAVSGLMSGGTGSNMLSGIKNAFSSLLGGGSQDNGTEVAQAPQQQPARAPTQADLVSPMASPNVLSQGKGQSQGISHG